MILRELLASTPVFEIIGRRRIYIKGIALLPEDVKEGYLYIHSDDKTKIPYSQAIDEAIDNGAIAITVGNDHEIPENTITFIRTYHYNRFISSVSRNFYNNPSQNMNLVGITGSHGKTTVGWMVKSILSVSGIPGVMIGTDYSQVGDHSLNSYSDMNPLNMNKFLYKAVSEKVEWGVIECTYTGIIDDRFSHVWFNSVIYTDLYTYFQNRKNDYHYFEMRKTLLDHLKTDHSPVIINVDDFYAFDLQRSTTVGYGLFNIAQITAEKLKLFPQSSEFCLVTPKGKRDIKLNIPGVHNVYNALAAVGWGLAHELELDDVVKGIEEFDEMPGLKSGAEFQDSIVVRDILDEDMDKIENVFASLKEEKKGDIVTVLCMDDSKDTVKYKTLGNIIGRHGGYCIMIHDYYSLNNDMDDMDDVESAAARKMDDIIIHHQTDYYKAIQKAVTLLPNGGHILLVRG